MAGRAAHQRGLRGRLRSAFIVAALAASGVVAVFSAAPANAAIGDIATFGSDVSGPTGIALGPDGNLWFVNDSGNSIGRTTPNGATTIFTDPAGNIDGPIDIVAGSDGNMWFTNRGNSRIGRIDPDASDPESTITTFTDPNIVQVWGIGAGPDGNVWFGSTGNSRIGRITPAGVITMFSDPDLEISAPRHFTTGPDGNVWFTSSGNNRIGYLDPDAADIPASIVTFDAVGAIGSTPWEIVTGSDNNLWFTSTFTDVSRITTTGT